MRSIPGCPITLLLKPLEAFPQGRSRERSDYLGHAPTRECWFANPTCFLLTPSRAQNTDTPAHSPVTPLLFGLIIPPNSPLDRTAVSSVQFAAVLFAHLLRHAPYCKDLARKIIPSPLTQLLASSTAGGAFFVPADGEPPPPDLPAKDDPEDAPQNLLALLTEHLSLAFLQRSRVGLAPREAREADRVICTYLSLLSQWLWEDPRAVREFLEAGGLGVLVEQLNQPSEIDVVVPGLCAFLLGVCYEFNREPGEVTRCASHLFHSSTGDLNY